MKRVYCSDKSVMVGDEDEFSPVKCRERRRRRMAMRRLNSPGVGSSALSVVGGADVEAKTSTDNSAASSAATAASIKNLINVMKTPPPPVYGMISVIGRQREMEDEVSARTNFCRPEINRFRPVHFFGVFDGHGGRHVSLLCKENMHVIMKEELMRVKVTGEPSNGGGGGEEVWRTAIHRSFQRMDEMALRLCLCGTVGGSNMCRCNPRVSFMGSTAVVSLVTKEYVLVANCGDSRAVLCRNGMCIPLSIDHKPDGENERARIEGRGGRVMYANGARVEGILAMSRAIGDRLLKQWITSEPEIMITKREAGDECLILASDGLWDVLSSELACKIAHECLETDLGPQIEPDEGAGARARARTPTEERPYLSRCDSAATLLVRLALGRQSSDNISVIVIDLRK